MRRRPLKRHGEGSSRRERRWLETVIASAAKQSILPLRGEMDCFAALAMTSKHTFAPSPRNAPEALLEFSAQRGRGERRMPVAPAASCALLLVKSTRVTTSTPESPDVPARNGLTAYNALSPEYRAFLPPSPSGYGTSAPGRADMPPKDLTPTTEASGPHDFAVRNNIVRQRAV